LGLVQIKVFFLSFFLTYFIPFLLIPTSFCLLIVRVCVYCCTWSHSTTHTHSVGLLRAKYRPDSENSTSNTQHLKQTATSQRDSNPQSQKNERPQTYVLELEASVMGVGLFLPSVKGVGLSLPSVKCVGLSLPSNSIQWKRLGAWGQKYSTTPSLIFGTGRKLEASFSLRPLFLPEERHSCT